ncbi:MAG TPA: acyl-[acyl-carrier-protein] thioesterase [Clostridiales bacterium]|nr:acyl-[acyl-carrier-protein] thioesterase [Clostridiales bacterium]
MYSFNSRVRYSELNHRKGLLDCSSIINYFQDCSTFQSEDLNQGLAYLQAANRVWLLNSWQLNILKPARLGDNILIGTWAYDFKGFYGYRNFIMKNDLDEVLAVANSIWVYVDTSSGKPTRIPKDYAATSGYGFEPAYPMEQAQRKIDFPEKYEALEPFVVTKSNIDSYNHVNNGQYVKLAEEYLPDDFIVRKMRVEYRAQATLGKIIIPLLAVNNNFHTIALADEQHNPYAIVEFHGSPYD